MEPNLYSHRAHSLESKFHEFIVEKNHPCIMANTVFQQENYYLHTYEKLGTIATARELIIDLKEYINSYDFEGRDFKSFLAVFPNVNVVGEIEFENLLWRQLQFLHKLDSEAWDPSVSPDPADANFIFSIGGRAFYVVGLHPHSSRLARRAPHPTLVFNLHSQFEKLRQMGVYHKVRNKIRERDTALQGNINPVLEDFGERSEARQYSGRQVESNWKCPFHP